MHTAQDRLGLTHVYTGNGKGKSTAAFGLALRAHGCGLTTAIVQFMKKGEGYGEIRSFQQLGIPVFSYGGTKFLKKGIAPDEENVQLAKCAMEQARQLMRDSIDLLVLDELSNAIFFELISECEAVELIQSKPHTQELVITGRNATPALMALADYVTDMQEVKHPYQQGIQARRGIEY